MCPDYRQCLALGDLGFPHDNGSSFNQKQLAPRLQPAWMLLLCVLAVPSTPQIHKIQIPKERTEGCVVASAVLQDVSVFHRWVQECSTESTSTVSRVAPVNQSRLNIYHKIVRRQDTPCTRVQVKQLVVRDMRVAQILNHHIFSSQSSLKRGPRATILSRRSRSLTS